MTQDTKKFFVFEFRHAIGDYVPIDVFNNRTNAKILVTRVRRKHDNPDYPVCVAEMTFDDFLAQQTEMRIAALAKLFTGDAPFPQKQVAIVWGDGGFPVAAHKLEPTDHEAEVAATCKEKGPSR